MSKVMVTAMVFLTVGLSVACSSGRSTDDATSVAQAVCIAADTVMEDELSMMNEGPFDGPVQAGDTFLSDEEPDDGAGKKCSASLKDPSGVSECKKAGDSVTLNVLCYKCGPKGENTSATVTSTCTGCGKAKAPKQKELDKACGK